MKDKIKIGVLGAYRGTSMINYCKVAKNAEVVAICDYWKEALDRQKEHNKDLNIAYYDNFDEFILHDMDAVVLANYANEHAPYAIKAMKMGKAVYSEVLPVQTLKEAVELCETVEETGQIYCYGENYCYMPAPFEMKKLYKQGKIGELEYAECEYGHNCMGIWPSIAYGDKNHWRNNMYSTYYCTHSIGPILHITGLRPVSVVGFESKSKRTPLVGAKAADFGIEMITLENGGIIRSLHMGIYKDSLWYRIDGDKGRMETAREDTNLGLTSRIYVNADEIVDGKVKSKVDTYLANKDREKLGYFGHDGSDYFSMYNFAEKVRGNKDADIIDVYEALNMSLPGMFAFRSILNNHSVENIPDFRDKRQRNKYRNDILCTDLKIAGKDVLPCKFGGNTVIDDEVYLKQKELFLKDLKSQNGYSNIAFTQSSLNKK